MTGKVLLLVAIAAVCDAAIIPLSHNWVSSGCRSRKEIDCLSDCCGSDIDYNRLFNALFPGTRYDSVGDFNFDGCSYDRSCDPADYFASYPEVRACKACPGLEFDALTSGLGCEGSYGCGPWPRCLPGCLPGCVSGCVSGCGSGCLPGCVSGCVSGCGSGCLPGCLPGCLKCGLCCRRGPRCSYGCERVIGPCYPEHMTCA